MIIDFNQLLGSDEYKNLSPQMKILVDESIKNRQYRKTYMKKRYQRNKELIELGKQVKNGK